MVITVGLVSPGAMGAAVGAAISRNGSRVVWASEGRSVNSQKRAAAAQIQDVASLKRLVEESDVVLSICPPHEASSVATAIAAHQFDGLYVDANAISPTSAAHIEGLVTAGGASYVDGCIIGPPPRRPGSTRLYLSGLHSSNVAQLFAIDTLEPVVLSSTNTASASALKMAFAGWSKGSAALLLTVRALAAAEGVEAALLGEWSRSWPELDARSERAATSGAEKGWRWVGEMLEISACLEERGLPIEFHHGAAEVFRRLAPMRGRKDWTVQDVIGELQSAFDLDQKDSSSGQSM